MQDRTLAIILKKQRGKTKEERGLEETAKLTRVRDKAKPQNDNLFMRHLYMLLGTCTWPILRGISIGRENTSAVAFNGT